MSLIATLVCAEPGRLELAQRPAPAGGEGIALVRPLRVGVCGTDFHIFEGRQPFLQYPRVMGHELAVEVLDAAGAPGLAAGDVCVVNPYLACGRCVACGNGRPNCCVALSVLGVHQDGGMAERLAVPAANLVPGPGLSADQCAMVEFLAIGAHAVRRGEASGRDEVLVVGAGPIGLGVALFARLAGARVRLFDRDGDRAGAVAAIAGAEPVGEADLAGSPGFDLVFDATGNARAMERGFELVTNGGRYVLVGIVKDEISFSDPDFHRKEMTLLASRNATSQDFARVIAAIRAGHVPEDRIITHRTSLAGAVRDIPRWATGKSGLIKALIEVA